MSAPATRTDFNVPAKENVLRLIPEEVCELHRMYQAGHYISDPALTNDPNPGNLFLFATADLTLLEGVEDGKEWSSIRTFKEANNAEGPGRHFKYNYREKSKKGRRRKGEDQSIFAHEGHLLEKWITCYVDVPMATVKYHMPGMHTLPKPAAEYVPTCPAPDNHRDLPDAVCIEDSDPFKALYLDERQLTKLCGERSLTEFMNNPNTTTIRAPQGGQLFLFDTRGTKGGVPEHLLRDGYSWKKMANKKILRHYDVILYNTQLSRVTSSKEFRRQIYLKKTGDQLAIRYLGDHTKGIRIAKLIRHKATKPVTQTAVSPDTKARPAKRLREDKSLNSAANDTQDPIKAHGAVEVEAQQEEDASNDPTTEADISEDKVEIEQLYDCVFAPGLVDVADFYPLSLEEMIGNGDPELAFDPSSTPEPSPEGSNLLMEGLVAEGSQPDVHQEMPFSQDHRYISIRLTRVDQDPKYMGLLKEREPRNPQEESDEYSAPEPCRQRSAIPIKGLKWKSGRYTNTCPIDGPLTLLALHDAVHPEENLIKTLKESLSNNVVQLSFALEAAKAGFDGLAQEIFGHMFMLHTGKIGSNDLNGEMFDVFMKPIQDIATFVRTTHCEMGTSCKRRSKEAFLANLPLSGAGELSVPLSGLVKSAVYSGIRVDCKACTTHYKRPVTCEPKLTQQNPESPAKLIHFERSPRRPFSNEEHLALDEKVTVDNETYTKLFSTLHRAKAHKNDSGHFIQVFTWENQLKVYDGNHQSVFTDFDDYQPFALNYNLISVTYIHRPK